MNADLLRQVGEALYGERWQSSLAIALHIYEERKAMDRSEINRAPA